MNLCTYVRCDLVHRNRLVTILTSLMVCGSFATEIWEAEYMFAEWDDPDEKIRYGQSCCRDVCVCRSETATLHTHTSKDTLRSVMLP